METIGKTYIYKKKSDTIVTELLIWHLHRYQICHPLIGSTALLHIRLIEGGDEEMVSRVLASVYIHAYMICMLRGAHIQAY